MFTQMTDNITKSVTTASSHILPDSLQFWFDVT